jgi:hypothetical protein
MANHFYSVEAQSDLLTIIRVNRSMSRLMHRLDRALIAKAFCGEPGFVYQPDQVADKAITK